MPELPEAEVVARQLRGRVLGATLKDSWIGRPDMSYVKGWRPLTGIVGLV